MSNEKFEIFVDLRDRASARLKRIGSGGMKMGRMLARGGAAALRGLGGLVRRLTSLRSILAGGALVGGIVKVTKAFWEETKSSVSLARAIARQHMSAKLLLPIYDKFANGLQRITTVGNETIKRIMALGLNMGISTGQIEDATKAAIGMSKGLEMDLQSAMKLVAKAAAGQTAELSRYGIVLDQGLTQQEKFNKVLELGAGLFANATDEAKESYGAWEQVKNSFGDLQERIGGAIDRVFRLAETFRSLRDWIDNVGTSKFESWLESVRDKAITAAKALGEIFSGGDRREQAAEGLALVITGSFKSAAHQAAEILMKYAPKIGGVIGNTIKSFILPSQNSMMRFAGIEDFRDWKGWERTVRESGMDPEENKLDRHWSRWSGEAKQLWIQNYGIPGTEIGADPGQVDIAMGRKMLEPFAPDEDDEGRRGGFNWFRAGRALGMEWIKQAEGVARAQLAEQKKQRKQVSTAREQMGGMVWQERYGAADDETKRKMLDAQGAALKKEYTGASWEDRPEIFERWLAARTERRSLDKDDGDKTQDLRKQISEMGRRQTQEIGVREYFRYMQNLRQGRAPDEETAANTREMVRLLEELARAEGLR